MTWKITGAPGTGENLLYSQAGTPTLDLRFASSKSLNDYVSGQNLVDFTRASSGTYVGSDGLIQTATTNEPRFNHDPTTGGSLGLLVEESRTNFLTYSELFTGWNVNTMVQSTASVAAPDGSPTVQLFTEDNTTNVHRIFSVPTTGNLTQTHSVFVKNASGTRRVYLSSDDASGVRQSLAFDLQTGTLASNSGGWTDPFITAYPNGWYRIGGTLTDNGGTTLFIVGLNDGALSSYLGDGTSGIYLWGAQLEAGLFPTSYISTTTAAVSRAADVASISGSNFSSWYRQDEGTVFTEYTAETSIPPANQAIVTIESAATDNGFRLYQQATTGRPLGQWQTPAGLQANFPFTSLAIEAGITSKIATAFADADFAGATSIQPGNIAVFNSGTVPTGLVSLGIGVRSSNSTFFANGTIRRLVYFDRRLPNATLQAITT